MTQLDSWGWVTQETTSWAPEYLQAAVATVTAARLTTLAAFFSTRATARAALATLRTACLAYAAARRAATAPGSSPV